MPEFNFAGRGEPRIEKTFGGSTMIPLYRLFYLLMKMVLVVLKPLLSSKTQKWIQLRAAIDSDQYKNLQLSDSLWVHASSGEIEYAKTLIRQIKIENPLQKIVVSYSSDSAEKLFENIRDFVDHFIPLPWDDAYSVSLMIKKIKPRVLIFSRTDLWPELIFQCARKKIPMVLISYFPKITFLNHFYLKSLLRRFRLISCVDTEVRQKIETMNLGNNVLLSADGDTRFDQVFARLENLPRFKIKASQKIFTFGSTWPEDEHALAPLFVEILKNQQHIILSPHDVSDGNIARLEALLTERKQSYRKLSEFGHEIDFQFPILLIDRIGYLADAYRDSDFAFVGGSFKSKVHSVMEPLCCGVPVLVGPHYRNNPEAIKYAEEKFVFVNEKAEDLLKNYRHLNQLDLKLFKQKIQLEMQKNKGASQKIARLIDDIVLEK